MSCNNIYIVGKKQMLDNGSSLARISSSNEPSESQSKPEPMAVEPDAPDDEPQPKIPNANSWTVSVYIFEPFVNEYKLQCLL